MFRAAGCRLVLKEGEAHAVPVLSLQASNHGLEAQQAFVLGGANIVRCLSSLISRHTFNAFNSHATLNRTYHVVVVACVPLFLFVKDRKHIIQLRLIRFGKTAQLRDTLRGRGSQAHEIRSA